MKTTVQMFVLLAAFASAIATSPAFAQGTALTYQGRLNAGGTPASGIYDLTFTLFTTNTGSLNTARYCHWATLASRMEFLISWLL